MDETTITITWNDGTTTTYRVGDHELSLLNIALDALDDDGTVSFGG